MSLKDSLPTYEGSEKSKGKGSRMTGKDNH